MRLIVMVCAAGVGCTGRITLGDSVPPDEEDDAAATCPVEDTGVVATAPGQALASAVTLSGKTNALFGFALEEGDIDGDGSDDLLVGAPGAEQDGAVAATEPGAVYLVFGPLSAEMSAAYLTFHGISVGDGAGATVAHGDFNKDGARDVVVGGGVPTEANPSASGFVAVAYGPFEDDVALSRATLITKGGEADAFGAALAVGDFTGDGIDDLAVGAPQEEPDALGIDRGSVSIYAGSENGLALAEAATITGGNADEARLGYALAALDANGDGVDDLLVGAPGANGVEDASGAAYLLAGPLAGSVTIVDAYASYLGTRRGDRTGASVDLADFDRDGYGDAIIGAPGSDATGLDAGAVFVFLGPANGASATATCDAVLTGEQPGSMAGTSVGFAHDMNGDGSFDLIVGAPGYDEADALDAGRGYLVRGPVEGTRPLGGEDHVGGSTPSARLGLSALGDTELTGDSMADIVFGAPGVRALDALAPGVTVLVAGK